MIQNGLLACAVVLFAISPLHSTALLAGQPAQTTAAPASPTFTGDLLPVFYVSDVLRSTAFYRSVGFTFSHFFDYDLGEQVSEWTKPTPPIWASFQAGTLDFALHRVPDSETLVVGGMKHYFLIEDAGAHHEALMTLGIEVSDLVVRPWMTYFSVTDPDGHLIYFGTEAAPADDNPGEK